MFEIGSTLRETRVRRKTTLQQAEDDTKIRVKYIQAMENEDFDLMPSPAYVKGFLRTYSAYLGLDANVMLDEYRSRFEPNEEHEPFGGNSALGRPHAHRRRNTLTFIAVVCLLILGLLYVLGRYNSNSNSPPTPPVTAVSHTPQATPSLHPSSHPSSPSSTASGLYAVRVVADRGACWVQVSKTPTAGHILYEATMSQGQSHTVRARGTIYVRLGVPAYVAITVGGKGSFRPAETAANTYRITRQGVVKL
ncbi:MAG TPA: RodZ domain-containing protein [Thermoleophilia bacterium]|nr:RodZ domain-containing protein [Thermoleophilia bacterium]